MKLSQTIKYINTALNYPALNYLDLDVFFDMAISELNTTLHTSIPLVKDMIKEFRQNLSNYDKDIMVLTSDPADDDFLIPVDPVAPSGLTTPLYYATSDKKYYLYNKYSEEYVPHKKLKAIYVTEEYGTRLYQAVCYSDTATWVEIPTDPQFEAELGDYLPDDWALLWLIPYVCFKYTVRDGGTAQSFAEELTQGYQQLQETYDIPSKVCLATYADKPAYHNLVELNLNNLNISVPTRAIYESMKHPRNINALFGSFYDRGGF